MIDTPEPSGGGLPRPWLAAITSAEVAARAIGQRLDRVTLSAPLRQDTAVLKLGWSTSTVWEPEATIASGVMVAGYSKPPDSLLAVRCPAEDRVIAAAWEIGAGTLHRYEWRPLRAGADPWEDRSGLTCDFGGMAVLGNAFGRLIRQYAAPGCTDLLPFAAQAGYVSYMFVPGRTTRGCSPPAWAKERRLGIPSSSDGHLHLWNFKEPTLPERPHHSHYVRATARQRACIVALRHDTGVDVGSPLPARLTVAEASSLIDRLRAVEAGNKPRQTSSR